MNELFEYSNSDIDLLVIDVLKNHSNESNKLKQVQILQFLQNDYNFNTTSRTLHTTLRRLIHIDKNIQYVQIVKANGDVEYKNWWYKQIFTDGELRFLIDYVKYNKNLLSDDKEDLCRRLKELSYSNMLCNVVLERECDYEINKLYIKNVEVINEAIKLEKQIKFHIKLYNIDKNYYLLDKQFVVIPEELVLKDGVYYLIARFNTPKKYHFRIDKIDEVEILTTNEIEIPVQYIPKNIEKYLEGRVHLISGDVEEIKLLINDSFIIDKLVTDFDISVSFTKTADNKIYALLKTNKKAFDIWVLKYKDMLDIIE